MWINRCERPKIKTIWLHDVRKPRFHVLGDKIFVDGSKLILPFLRLFGGNISKLIIMFRKKGGHNQRIDEYVHQYCADTLSSISFHDKPEFFGDYSRPLIKIETVHFVNSALHDNLRRCIDWFPNMRQLEIDLSVFRWHLHFQHNAIYFHQVEVLLRANAQLQSLHIYADHCNFLMRTSHLLDVIGESSFLTKLTASITAAPSSIIRLTEAQQLIREHPQMAELRLKMH